MAEEKCHQVEEQPVKINISEFLKRCFYKIATLEVIKSEQACKLRKQKQTLHFGAFDFFRKYLSIF